MQLYVFLDLTSGNFPEKNMSTSGKIYFFIGQSKLPTIEYFSGILLKNSSVELF